MIPGGRNFLRPEGRVNLLAQVAPFGAPPGYLAIKAMRPERAEEAGYGTIPRFLLRPGRGLPKLPPVSAMRPIRWAENPLCDRNNQHYEEIGPLDLNCTGGAHREIVPT